MQRRRGDAPRVSVEQLARAAFPELELEDPLAGRLSRLRTVGILAKLVDRGKLVRLERGRYALP